ncbi:MAG TPA: hypothetical protein VGU25_09025 [Acidobacteriaceae bacterium]|nr:hypothetical protein [Acidobacteriaceae bacterium]
MSERTTQSLFQEAADWDLFDVNVRLGSSGVNGQLALDADGLLAEMEQFHIQRALVSHWETEEYDVALGNETLSRELRPQMVPVWGALPDMKSVEALAAREPVAVRLTPSSGQHNFSLESWCAGPLFSFLQESGVITLIVASDVGWSGVATLLKNFPRLPLVLLDTGYRADRYLFPLLDRYPSLHFDSSTYLAHRQLEAFIQTRGPERVLFGSRLPLYTPASALAVLSSARIRTADRLAVAGGNLRRLLAGAQFGGAR